MRGSFLLGSALYVQYLRRAQKFDLQLLSASLQYLLVMQVLDLPLVAFECVIEHMVVGVGLHKAVKLRRVCSKILIIPRRTLLTVL